MANEPGSNDSEPLAIGAVCYLNSRPLTAALERLAPTARIDYDLPSRLADSLAAGRLDVALVPSIEYFRHPGWTIVSDACVACDGPVESIKLFGRVPVEEVRTLALDEGSRTSAALARIVLKERIGLEPKLGRLPIGDSLADSDADAVLLIGDRAMQMPEGPFAFVWDLGQEWSEWTGLPFVFAMWIARSDVPTSRLASLIELFSSARDDGVGRVEEIARREAPLLGLPEAECLAYLRDRLIFRLGPREREGLKQFGRLAARHGLAPGGATLVFAD